MIKVIIDWDRLLAIKLKILKSIILKRAYIGYCSWINMEYKFENNKETPLTFEEFKDLELWKIKIAFKQYFYYIKKENYLIVKINFKSVVFNIQ